jgi:hypothetical protein
MGLVSIDRAHWYYVLGDAPVTTSLTEVIDVAIESCRKTLNLDIQSSLSLLSTASSNLEHPRLITVGYLGRLVMRTK